jgi:Spy/CpxP family protein refolding chaperone
MKEELALTPEQIEKIKPIVDRDKTRSRQLVADKSLSQADRQKKLNAMMKASLDEIFPHLTPEQQAKWKEYKSKQRAAREKK